MTAYKKNLWTWACIMVVELSLGFAALYISNWFVVPFFMVIYTIRFVLERIVCPNCGTSVTYQGILFGKEIRGGFIRRKCQKCGWDLDKEL